MPERFAPFEPSPAERPQNVGIHAIDVYFPQRCIAESDLEQFDGVSAGKYTIGLGQEHMAFCDDREDINSFLLTVTRSLLQKYNIPTSAIGRLDVGTETLIDKAKAVKTVLMDLFPDNSDIEGIDSKNACYGGTAALFNAANWIESSSWDGRYALVVCGDIAIYAAGGARPVGGAGAVAMLVGPNAPIVLEPVHGTHMQHVYDFYKPRLSSEYPEVDGPLTQVCYPGALEKSYDAFRAKEARRLGKKGDMSAFTIDDLDFVCFHSPYQKLVQKGYARLAYNDYLTNPTHAKFKDVPAEFKDLDRAKTILNKDIEKCFVGITKEDFKRKVGPSTLTSRKLGNMYAGSLYGSLASLINAVPSAELQNKRVGLYSYGSGLAASFFTAKVVGNTDAMRKNLDLDARIAKMHVRPVQEFLDALELREKNHNNDDWTPSGKVEDIADGSFYLVKNDAHHRRTYLVRGEEKDAAAVN
ncbi:hypothetical protein ACM66B_003620 [Microbotryomycetes sp. NB124-2]